MRVQIIIAYIVAHTDVFVIQCGLYYTVTFVSSVIIFLITCDKSQMLGYKDL